LYASYPSPPQAIDYIRNPGPIKRIYRAEHPPIATSEININVNLNAVDTIPLNNLFDPNDPNSFNFQTDFVIYDSLGANHIASLYYVKSPSANEWNVYSYVDGSSLSNHPGELAFTTNGQIRSVTNMNALIFCPNSGATSPQIFMVKFDDSTQYASKSRLRSFEQNGSPNDPNYARRN
jgi:flagellar hook protein FlgE